MIHPIDPIPTSRRGFLRSVGGGFGSVAMAAMAADQALNGAGHENPLAPKQPQFPPKAKRVILLWMQGGPSQMDLFDFKPRLKSEAGNKIPFKVNAATERFDQSARLMPAISNFKQVGQNGMWMSDLMPNLRDKVDELCWLRAMQTDSPAHPGAIRATRVPALRRPRRGGSARPFDRQPSTRGLTCLGEESVFCASC